MLPRKYEGPVLISNLGVTIAPTLDPKGDYWVIWEEVNGRTIWQSYPYDNLDEAKADGLRLVRDRIDNGRIPEGDRMITAWHDQIIVRDPETHQPVYRLLRDKLSESYIRHYNHCHERRETMPHPTDDRPVGTR